MKTSRQWFFVAATVLGLGLVELRVAMSPARPPDLGYSGADMGPEGPGYLDVTMHSASVNSVAPGKDENDLPDGLREILEARKGGAIDLKDRRRFQRQVMPPVEDVQGFLLPAASAAADRDASELGSAPSWGWLADGVLETKRTAAGARSALDETAILRPPIVEGGGGFDDLRASLPDTSLPAADVTRDAVPGGDPFASMRDLLEERSGEGSYSALPGTLTPGLDTDGIDTRHDLRDRSADTDSLLLDTRRKTFSDTLKIPEGTSAPDAIEPSGRSRRRLRDEDDLGTIVR